jgi:hypothetical protein
MYRGLLTALLGGVTLAAFAVLPPMSPGSTTLSLSGSAQAATTVKSSKSNGSERQSLVASLLARYPAGGPALRAAIAAAVEADPDVADTAVLLALKANAAQKLAIGAGLADAANFYAKGGSSESKLAAAQIRTAMAAADAGTRAGFLMADAPTLAPGIPGFNNTGANTNGCVTAVKVSPSKPKAC